MHPNLVANLALGEPVQMHQQPHPNHHRRVHRRTAHRGLEFGHLEAYEREVEDISQLAKKTVLQDQLLHGHHLEEALAVDMISEHGSFLGSNYQPIRDSRYLFLLPVKRYFSSGF
jgi:hypothetical protein